MRRTSKLLMIRVAVAASVCLLLTLYSSAGAPNWPQRFSPTTHAAQTPPVQSSAEIHQATKQKVLSTFGKLPLYFIENRGQLDARVAYYVQGADTTVYFTSDGVTFALSGKGDRQGVADTSGHRSLLRPVALGTAPAQEATRPRWALKLDFLGATPGVKPTAQDPTPALISYFKGAKSQWKTGLKTYGTLAYADLWPGIDLVYSGTVNRLKYTFVVKPGADPRCIKLAYRGATAVKLTESGKLEVSTPVGGFYDEKPYAYQEGDGQRAEVAAAYALDHKTTAGVQGYGFNLGPYDKAKPLVLDPAMLVYAGYIGGAGADEGNGIAVDTAGNAYVTGETSSTGVTFPETVGPDLTFNGGFRDAFVAKVKADGTALVYAGYIGGGDDDRGLGVAVDSAGNAYVTGLTFSTEATFPVTGGPDPTHNGGIDAFVAKVNALGTALDYAGYIGGTSSDQGRGIAVDTFGNAYVTGLTDSTEATFPVTGGPDLTHNGGTDAFVAKVNAAGTGLDYAGYLGGSGTDQGLGIAVDTLGNAYVTGVTGSAEASFSVTVGPDLTHNGGTFDAFVAKVNAAGTALLYAGYIGGLGFDAGQGIAVDTLGDAYVTGSTDSTEATFPETVGPDLTFNGGFRDTFVAKVNIAGTGLDYAGYIGGAGDDRGFGIAVDSVQNAYVTGLTTSTGATFPETGGPDLIFNGVTDAFVAKVNLAGTGLDYAGYIGGGGGDEGLGIAVDTAGNAYITGLTTSTEATFPETGGPDLIFNGGSDAFVAKIAEIGPPATMTLEPTTDTNPVGTSHTVTATVTDAGGNPVPNVVVRFSVTGSVTASGSCTTSANTGQCNFTYQGPNFPGADVITAFADTNNNGVQDQGEPSGGATKTWAAGAPATLMLTPAADTNPLGTSHTVTATVEDAFGNPVPGVKVRFSVTGANSASGSSTTDANGQASFTYTGTSAGLDTISAFADINGNGTQDVGEPFGKAAKTWVAGAPATLTLAPPADANPVGTEHCVTATVKDAFGNPTPGVTVRFKVTGSVTTSGSATTNASGQATFCYTGPDLPGADAITAYADTDNDNVQDPGEPSGAATKTWVLPITTPLCQITITKGGRITAANGDKATFGGNAKSSATGQTTGQEEYQDHGPVQRMNVKSINVQAIVCEGTMQASIYGQATINGSGSFFYRINVKDLADPGVGMDTYWILLQTGYDSGEKTLEGGNVQIRRR